MNWGLWTVNLLLDGSQGRSAQSHKTRFRSLDRSVLSTGIGISVSSRIRSPALFPSTRIVVDTNNRWGRNRRQELSLGVLGHGAVCYE